MSILTQALSMERCYRGLPVRAFLFGALFLVLPVILTGCDDGSGESHTLTDSDAISDDQLQDEAELPPADADLTDQETNDAEDQSGDQAADLPPDDEELLGPPYPIVLAHGMGGFENLADVEAVPYFYGIKDALEGRGELVLTEDVDPLNTSDARGADLLVSIEEFLATTGHEKCIIIGHSQGGLDARWVAHTRPDLVAAVVTVATPHLGTPISDIILGLVENDNFQAIVDAMVQFFGQPLYDELGNESSVFAPLRLFASNGIEDFNTRITDADGVAYYSIAGRSDYHFGGLDCAPDQLGQQEFIDRWVAESDPIDPLLAVTEAALDGGLADPYPNDGLVRARDARWGRFLGCIPADHMDQVGQLLGDDPGLLNSFDHVEFWLEMVDFLRAEGY